MEFDMKKLLLSASCVNHNVTNAPNYVLVSLTEHLINQIKSVQDYVKSSGSTFVAIHSPQDWLVTCGDTLNMTTDNFGELVIEYEVPMENEQIYVYNDKIMFSANEKHISDEFKIYSQRVSMSVIDESFEIKDMSKG
jgi:hypothetical protein